MRRQSGRALRMGFVLDVAGYGGRSVPGRDSVQQRLRRLVVATLAECGLRLDATVVDHQWTGDGINAILPADIDPTAVLAVLLRSLTASLSRDNAEHADRIRLRMAIGVGLVERNVAGFGGPVIVDINRLVDSAALRSALDAEPTADLAVALSDHAFALIIQPGYPGIPVAQFTRADVAAKEFSGPAWIWVSTRQWSEPAYLPLGPGDPREADGWRIVARLGEGQAGTVYLANVAGAAGAAVPGASPFGGGRAIDGGSGFAGESIFGGDADDDDGDSGAVNSGWAAVKMFDQQLTADPDVRRRLPVGVLAASVVRHPHLTSVIDCGALAGRGQRWVASTLVRGPSLAAVVTETGPLPAETPGWIALGVAGALAMLHETGLAHHAVCPRNVLLGGHGPVLTDFGTSRAALVAGPGAAADDVLMLGVTALYAATGRSPWADIPAPLAPGIRVTVSVPPGESDLDGCPPWLAPIVLACLAADPAKRPTAERLHAWLLAEVGHQPRSWLPGPVAARVTECQALPPPRGRLRWPRGRES
ncbi:hypothetical protein EAS64_01645 [Trebonia kvetii]|uniref:Protein kinase domain-containing protein n=1 Tax=Trebonia kvetii TaxID=2480626 RepID=A0A6P2C426_9ACTN|nr:hypothetical protein [Trebonia kvetii]TVZ06172.1 hypothetical protein EAS64_01645 [Trebonia kvetii]